MKRRTGRYTHSLLGKVLFVYFLIFAVPIIFLSASLQRTSRKMAQNEGSAQLLSSLKSISHTMDEVFRSVNYVQAQLQGNTAFSDDCFQLLDKTLLPQPDYDNYQLCQHLGMELYKLYLSNPYLYSLELYTPYGDTLFANSPGRTRQIIYSPSEDQVRILQGDPAHASSAWHPVSSDTGSTCFASYYEPYCSSNPNLTTYTRALISVETLQNHVDIYNPSGTIQFYIHPDAGERIPISPSSVIDESSLPTDSLSGSQGSIPFYSHGISCIFVYFYSQYTDWYYSAAVPLEYYNISQPVITEYWYYTLAALALIFFFTALFVSFYLIRPMKQISGTMKKAEHGDLNVRIQTTRRDELGYIGHRLNVLLENISSLIHTNYETRLLKEGYELKFIQTQLKEHFIYNTLDYIHWLADKHHVPTISQIIFDLSRFFRLTLNNGSDYISIEEEADLLKSYLSLYNIRMDGKLSTTIRIDETIKKEKIIKYFFQPILENSILHGLYPIGGGEIHISFSQSPSNRICYCVQDNGVGISPLTLNDIRLCIQEDRYDDKYFALVNLNRQLRLYYGNRFTFEIDSRPGHGTTVIMEIPKESEHLC